MFYNIYIYIKKSYICYNISQESVLNYIEDKD